MLPISPLELLKVIKFPSVADKVLVIAPLEIVPILVKFPEELMTSVPPTLKPPLTKFVPPVESQD